MTVSIMKLGHTSLGCRYAECCDYLKFMLSDIMLNIFMLSVVILNDVMLSVVAPNGKRKESSFIQKRLFF